MSPYLTALTFSIAYEISLGGLILSLTAERNSPVAIKKLATLYNECLLFSSGPGGREEEVRRDRRRTVAVGAALDLGSFDRQTRRSGGPCEENINIFVPICHTAHHLAGDCKRFCTHI